MNMKVRKAWGSLLEVLLKEKDESAGVTGIRAELCCQILNMSKEELFEFCQELESIPGMLNKPGLAMDCDTCRKEFGTCMGQYRDVDFNVCEDRFWRHVEKQAAVHASA